MHYHAGRLCWGNGKTSTRTVLWVLPVVSNWKRDASFCSRTTVHSSWHLARDPTQWVCRKAGYLQQVVQ